MKTRYSIFIICLLAILATGCKKDNHRIRIFARNMVSDSKILINPNDVNSATWVAGESIFLYINDEDNHDEISGTYLIGSDSHGFYIDVDPVGAVTSAFYPAGSFGGNDIEYDPNAGFVLRHLNINFHSNGTYDVVFPMIKSEESNGNSLLFDHVTAGLKLTLTVPANSDPVNVASVRIVARNSSPMETMEPYICSWAVENPIVPTGGIGITGDQEVLCSSEMDFDLTTNGVSGATVTSSGLSFCIPVTISQLNGLTVIGYSTTGEVLFHVTKGFSQTSLSVNTMYTIPAIIIGSDSDVGSNDEMD